jgi:hypothetical protein
MAFLYVTKVPGGSQPSQGHYRSNPAPCQPIPQSFTGGGRLTKSKGPAVTLAGPTMVLGGLPTSPNPTSILPGRPPTHNWRFVMFGYPPTPEEYDEVYRQLWHVFENCVLVYELMAVEHLRTLCDLPDSPAEIEEKEAAAFREVTYLNGLLYHLPQLAATDFPALGEVWPKVLGALESYTEDYQELEEVRKLAKRLGVALWAAVDQAFPGRPRATSPIAGDPGELWQAGSQVLARFQGEDPGRIAFARAYLRQKGIRPRVGTDHANPAHSLLRRAKSLGVKGGHEGLIKFLRGPKPES